MIINPSKNKTFTSKAYNRFLSLASLLALILLASNSLWAITPTPAQIEQFKNLSPTDQKRLAKQFGVSIPAGALVGATTTKMEAPITVTPRPTETAKPDEASITKFAKLVAQDENTQTPLPIHSIRHFLVKILNHY